jgi:hypothetical protein
MHEQTGPGRYRVVVRGRVTGPLVDGYSTLPPSKLSEGYSSVHQRLRCMVFPLPERSRRTPINPVESRDTTRRAQS